LGLAVGHNVKVAAGKRVLRREAAEDGLAKHVIAKTETQLPICIVLGHR